MAARGSSGGVGARRAARAVLAVLVAQLAACGADGGGAAPAAGALVPLPAGAARGYDLLLVTFDTTRADRLGCYGHASARTPTLDGLAARGLRFERAFAPAPLTLPAHASLMTGLDPPRHGARNNGTFALAAEHETLAERLAAAGYATGAVVGAFVLDARYGLDQGFASYDDALEPPAPGAAGGHYVERPASAVTDAALAWLARAPAGPRFLWVHYFDPHAPYAAPPPEARAAAERGADAYDAELEYADRQLGRLLRGIGPERLARTLVVATADHGEALGEHGEPTHGLLVYDATLRVPLVLACPTLFDGALVERGRAVGLVDVAPTVLALLGLDVPSGLDGRALVEPGAAAPRALYGESLAPWYNHGWAALFTLRRGEHKLVLAPRPEYYDTARDPGELENRWEQRPPAARELERELRARLAAVAPPERVAEGALDAEEARALEQLGYARSATPAGGRGRVDPKDGIAVFAAMARAQAASDAGREDEARGLVEQALARSPGDAYVWETAYLVRLRAGDLEGAEAALRRTLELEPTAEGWVRLAQLLLRRRAGAEVDAALERALALDPRSGGVHVVLAERHRRDGRLAEARAEYERALELDPVRTGALARARLRQLDGR